MELINLVKNNPTYNLIYFLATLFLASFFVFSVISSHSRKKFSKTYINEMTEMVKKTKER